ncbi:MAG: PHP domain-containing protein [Gordonia sp. (in: high G+C Gram-positive bacteria)]|uniref:PHP domain-containing protein n=1 Tax=Gordonia sp. (in: high G+C Gram-positive bacteria) TaxID=84139 RepID=UPI0039E4DCA2
MSLTADLHTHTEYSDGTDSIAEWFAAARAAGLTTIALTDHDTDGGWDEARALVPAGMRVIPGTEFSTKHPGPDGELVSVHLLGYLFDRDDPAVVAEWTRMRDERAGRGGRIVELLVDGGYPISLERVQEIAGPSSIGRPHIARALMEAGAVGSVGEAFDDLLHDGSPYYAALRSTSLIEGLELITGAGGVPVIAHPRARAAAAVLTPEVFASLVPHGLRGIEVDHPDHDDDARAELRGIAADLDLLTTGSSDYHGANKTLRIGQERTPDAVVEQIIALGRTEPFGG